MPALLAAATLIAATLTLVVSHDPALLTRWTDRITDMATDEHI